MAKACTDARAMATVNEEQLPHICGDSGADMAMPSTAGAETSKGAETLAATLTKCLAGAESAISCDPIKAGNAALLSP